MPCYTHGHRLRLCLAIQTAPSASRSATRAMCCRCSLNRPLTSKTTAEGYRWSVTCRTSGASLRTIRGKQSGSACQRASFSPGCSVLDHTDFVHSCYLQHLPDEGRWSAQNDRTPLRHDSPSIGDDADPRCAHEGCPRKVDHEGMWPIVDQLGHESG